MRTEMTTDREGTARIINGLAAAISLLVALSLPLGYGLVAYHHRSEELSFKARVKASALNDWIATTPDLWRYAESQLPSLLAREPVRLEAEQIRVLDAQGTLVAEAGTAVRGPLLIRGYPLLDAGHVVGRLDVSGSLHDMILATGVAAALGLLLGALVFTTVQFLLWRALRPVTDALLEERKQRGALLDTVKLRDQALQESEARFRALHEASFGGISIHENSVILDCNQALSELTGFTVDELIGMDGMQLIAPEWRELARRRAASGYERAYEIEGLRRDGTRCPLSVQGKSIPYKGRSGVRVTEFRDISELKQTLEALRASEESLSITLNSIGDAVIATDTDGCVTRMNRAAERLTAWSLGDALGRPLPDVFRIVNADTRAPVANPVQRVMERREVVCLANPTVLLARDGNERHIADSAAPIRNVRNEIVGVVLVFSDVTENYQTRETLRQTQAMLQAAIDQTPAGISIADAPDGTIRYINDAGLAIRGLVRDSVIGQDVNTHFSSLAIFDLDGHPLNPSNIPITRAVLSGETGSREFIIRRADDSERIVAARAAPVRNTHGKVVAAISVSLDITESKMAEDEIRRLAFYDQLTGLPNRRLLLDRLTQAVASRVRYPRGGALLFIDLDNFKTINDTLGHDVGDALLKQVSARLLASVRAGDTVARLGGDEFVVLLDGLSTIDAEAATQAELVGEKLIATLNQDYQIVGRAHKSTASIGIALFEHPIKVEELLKRADLAMYQAKNAGRNTLCFFDPRMQAMVLARAALEADLREAIRDSQFVLFYQAQVDASARVFGAEALLRWRRPDGTILPPGEFIALAEETGLILAIGKWVLEASCRQLATWATQPLLEALTISVNVSARQFHHPDFVKQVLQALQVSGAPPRRLRLELTESLLINDVDDVVAKICALRTTGIRFSLDDFGTGYSSLAYLKRLPLDQLKIDRTFVSDLLSDANDAAIVRTIVALGKSLGLAVIAEGVENEAQKDALAAIGCRYYQGYHFGRPLAPANFERSVRTAADDAAVASQKQRGKGGQKAEEIDTVALASQQ